MAQRIQIAIDFGDPYDLAEFWTAVLGYQLMEPPDGYSSWQEHAAAQAEEPGEAWVKIADPDDRGPTVLFHRVPEAKLVKNRVHLDVRALPETIGDRREQVVAFVDRIMRLGGSKVRDVIDDAGYFAVLQDPEGNEFCVG